jgi:ABC-type antimicrobial peptide transport system permease subunit
MTIVVRAPGDPALLARTVKDEIYAVDPSQPLNDLVTLPELLHGSVSPQRFTLLLLGSFALVALVLAAVGVYGVIAYAVGQRTREIGIRMALGAGRRSIASIVIGRAGGATGVGIVVGAVLAVVGTSVLESRVFGLEALSFGVFIFAALVLAGAAVVAAWLPASRATRVDPVSAMRVE